MEVNRLVDVFGCIPTADVVEGMFGLMTTHSFSADFGSQTDIPGFKVPATAEEAKRAKYCITWAQENRELPIYSSIPSYTYALRQGFDRTTNVPFSATVYVTQPNHQEGLTIPSGVPSLAFGEGIYTVGTANYIADASLVAGALVIVANTAEDTTDAGKLKYQATMDERVVGVVLEKNTTTGKLTVKISD